MKGYEHLSSLDMRVLIAKIKQLEKENEEMKEIIRELRDE